MFLAKYTLILGTLLAVAHCVKLAGFEVPDAPDGLEIIEHRMVNGTDGGPAVFVFYGDSNPTPTPARTTSSRKKVKRVCGSADEKCYASHRANSGVCAKLIHDLETSPAPIKRSPRAVCQTHKCCGVCCISWADPVINGIYPEMASPAWKVLGYCTNHQGMVSGLTRNTLLGETCTTQCVSNRPDGCE